MIGILWPAGGRWKAGSVRGKRFAAAILAIGFALLGTVGANADTRSLKLLNLHTREKAEIVFKRNGRYDQDGLRKLNQFLRDWRKNEPTRMDPRLFDLIWEAYKQSGSDAFINVVCGYRSPGTNSMLRSRSKGVAKKSQHMLGKAMDFFIPDVKLKRLREIGLKMQGGGVGYYPTSGSPFVHFDVGNVRHWPKMSRRELIALFPNGKTLHVPSDGKPLPGFEQAVAAYQARKKSGDVAVASAGSSSSSRSGGLLAAFFGGGGADDEEDSASVGIASAGDEGAAPPKAVAKAEVKIAKAEPKQDNKIRILQPDQVDRADIPGVEAAEPKQPAIMAALPDQGAPLPDFAPRPQVDVGQTATAGLYAAPGAEGDQPIATQVALNVPLPTPRPLDSTPPELVKDSEKDAIMLAAASDVAGDADPTAPLPQARPEEDGDDDTVASGDAIASMIVAAVPADRPAGAETDSTVLASLPAQSAVLPADPGFPQSPDEIIPEAKSGDPTMLSYAGTQKGALIAKAPGTDPVAAVVPSVKTTTKSARATRKDLKKAVKQPQVVAAQPSDARWALDSSWMAESTKKTKAPSFNYGLVHNAPSEVLTAGFQQGVQVADARRFTGKAVTFLSVAKFQTN